MERKPKCKLMGTDGNIFTLIRKASRTLQAVGQRDKATEMCERVFASRSYVKALAIIQEYIDVR